MQVLIPLEPSDRLYHRRDRTGWLYAREEPLTQAIVDLLAALACWTCTAKTHVKDGGKLEIVLETNQKIDDVYGFETSLVMIQNKKHLSMAQPDNHLVDCKDRASRSDENLFRGGIVMAGGQNVAIKAPLTPAMSAQYSVILDPAQQSWIYLIEDAKRLHRPLDRQV
ncbi:hypothetical protein PFICI_09965 [Pestalotiopsis fici W106-1]|uniref:Uncharacterized protein n=1 Tax=Pestalotiopsis fici (strain W106-1 / CGMCC3.15140) TaxID=1229662 RepID=W3WVK5_PESFW|nr:uncharacterized protein PFICI_09965 [Pestalotiopsis fici W106-1]ETS77903.1 hypothetical protein PFICI_09965 [Pestalotiopsis fici W106-1]